MGTEYEALNYDGTERRANYRFVSYRIDILHILGKKEAAAIIFEILYRWETDYHCKRLLKEIEARKKAGLPPLTEEEVESQMWTYMSYNDFVRESGSALGYNTIIRMLAYLIEMGIVEQRENHDPRYPDYEYRINKEVVRKLLKELPVAPVFAAKIPKKKRGSTQMGTPTDDSTHLGTPGQESTQMGTGYTQPGTEVYPFGGTSQIPTENSQTHHKEESMSADDSATQTFAPDVARPPLSSLGYSSEELIAEATRVERLSLKEECPIVTATPETTQSMSTRNTPVENKPEQQSLMPDKKPKAPSKSKEKHTEELNPGMLPADLKPKGPPSVPSADAPWPSKETAVQIVEAKKGRAYSKTTRAQELAEAGKVLEMAVDNAPITREQFESAWDDLASSSWWEEHGKPCMIKYLRRDDTIVGIIKKLARKGQTRTKTTSTQVQNTTTARVDEEAAKRNFDRMMASVAAKGVN